MIIRRSSFRVWLRYFFTWTSLTGGSRIDALAVWQHPSFFAYFPTAGTFEGMLGDLLSSSTASPGFNVRLKVGYKLRDKQIGSSPHETVVCKPRLHRARGCSHGLGRQDVWTTRRLLECERGGRRCHSGQILVISPHTHKLNLICLDYRV
jgi:hypothetical protein